MESEAQTESTRSWDVISKFRFRAAYYILDEREARHCERKAADDRESKYPDEDVSSCVFPP